MTRPHPHVLRLGRRIAAELAGQACDPDADMSMADRFALATLSLAVDEEASRRAGVEPLTGETLPLLAADLARIERTTLPTPSAPLQAAG